MRKIESTRAYLVRQVVSPNDKEVLEIYAAAVKFSLEEHQAAFDAAVGTYRDCNQDLSEKAARRVERIICNNLQRISAVHRYIVTTARQAREGWPQRLAENREPDAMQNTGGPGHSTFASNQWGQTDQTAAFAIDGTVYLR